MSTSNNLPVFNFTRILRTLCGHGGWDTCESFADCSGASNAGDAPERMWALTAYLSTLTLLSKCITFFEYTDSFFWWSTCLVREEQKKLSKQDDRSDDRSESDIKALQSVCQIIREVLRQLDEERFIGKAANGPRYLVGCRRYLDKALLKPGTRIALDMTTLDGHASAASRSRSPSLQHTAWRSRRRYFLVCRRTKWTYSWNS